MEENQQVANFNKEDEAEKAAIDRLKAEEAELERKLKELEEGEVPPLQ